MREIKFRVWDNVLKFYPKDNFTIDTNGNVYLSTRPRIIKLLKKWNVDIEKRDDYIIEQYTGLKDKNGKDVYEGDCIGCKENVVEFSNGCWNINGDRPLSMFVGHYVIGNIHEQ